MFSKGKMICGLNLNLHYINNNININSSQLIIIYNFLKDWILIMKIFMQM